MTIQRHVLIRGRVQGVGFRASTHATVLGEHPEVRGWVRNLPDGAVEAVFQGEADQVETLIGWCRKGPPAAEVDEVEVHEQELDKGLTGFRVRRD